MYAPNTACSVSENKGKRPPDQPIRERSVVLVHVRALKNPFTGNISEFSGHFDRKADGTYIVKLDYPKNIQAELAKCLNTYSKDALKIERVEEMVYVFDSQ